tara:strand:- start:168 stop:794 length:627 start_codon:yes stop_codon:yes gene_type:complete
MSATAGNSSGALNSGENSLAKRNYDAIEYGNRHGRLKFGHIHKEGDVTSAILLEASDAEHSFCMDADGVRDGWTSSIQPGHFQLECGSSSTQAEDSLMLNAKNGNICITANNGNIRLEADNIEFVARGDGTPNGNFKVTASEKISFHSKEFHVNAKNLYKIATPNRGEIIANGVLKIYSSIIRGVTDASKNKDSKVGGKKYVAEQNQV